MKLNHLNLAVSDVAEAQNFLQKYFGLRPAAPGTASFALLLDDDGFVLTLMKAGENGEAKYPASFHIGFVQESEEAVNEIHQKLRDDGFEVKPPRRFHGSWTFYLSAPGGFLVEVLC